MNDSLLSLRQLKGLPLPALPPAGPAPAPAGATVCLCMIVKNEQHVIRRALLSVRDWIDYWVICDTGSSDDTPSAIMQTLAGVPGELHRTEWVNFGHNRAQVLRLAKEKADYSLILDADMVASVQDGLKSRLTADCYDLRYEGGVDYSQVMLVSNRHDWRYVGTTHEYITSDTASSAVPLSGLTLRHLGDGGMRGDKFERDIRMLLQEHEQDPANPRPQFYLAQSYRDLERYEEALVWYERRAACAGSWEEETFQAMLQAGRMRWKLGRDWASVQEALLGAYAFRPSRLEPLHELAQACRLRGDMAQGFLYSKAYEGHPYPSDRLFIDRAVYTYKLALEHGVCAYGIGALEAALKAFNHVLSAEGVADGAADAALRGIQLCLEAQAAQRPAGPQGPAPTLQVIVPFHNPGHFLDNCVESLLRQDYPHARFIFMDDASDDGSAAAIPADDPRVLHHRNPVRRGAACTIHTAVTRYCQPSDVVVLVDGDDWLLRDDALSVIASAYRDPGCWVMYGQYQTSAGEYGICRPYPGRAAFSRLRESWQASHLKSYRAGLFHRLQEQDPEYACLKDGAGEWLRSAVDAAFMYPLMELAGHEHIRFNSEPLYLYNVDNPRSLHWSGAGEQARNFHDIQRRRRFSPVTSYLPGAGGAP